MTFYIAPHMKVFVTMLSLAVFSFSKGYFEAVEKHGVEHGNSLCAMTCAGSSGFGNLSWQIPTVKPSGMMGYSASNEENSEVRASVTVIPSNGSSSRLSPVTGAEAMIQLDPTKSKYPAALFSFFSFTGARIASAGK